MKSYFPKHKQGAVVNYEGKKYIAGKFDSSVNLRYLHNLDNSPASDSKNDFLQVNETRLTSN